MKQKVSILFADGRQMSQKYKMSAKRNVIISNTMTIANKLGYDISCIKTIKISEVGE